ncbi:hypothetical protein KTC92_15645 [Clostridium sp. CM027]|uniref:hypothetical protein n=1 Tax=Clostridium sp. CM027 TaxID=2849865 RepID=UPI001C6EC90D|nr:hypothetical protein [Clostridium sp. CM027]MBW9144715.1 hypothetical protein [Clostridium sp. CM027]UVE40535.1 hypothetical protein KTC92_15645 [Clostridium sp. CM027]
MLALILIVILLIPILLTIVILDKHTKNKTPIQIMLIGIEVTIVGVAIIVIGGGASSNEIPHANLIGFTIVVIGLTSSIYGFNN